MHVSWWVGVDSAPWRHDLGPWGAVSTRAGIPAALACMHAAGLSTRTSCMESRSAHVCLHLWPVCSRLLSQSDWCRSSSRRSWKHPWKRYLLMYSSPNSGGTNKPPSVCWRIQDSCRLCCFISSEKVNCNWTFQLTVISTLSLTVSHSCPTHPPLCGYSRCVEITETPPSSHPINPFQAALEPGYSEYKNIDASQTKATVSFKVPEVKQVIAVWSLEVSQVWNLARPWIYSINLTGGVLPHPSDTKWLTECPLSGETHSLLRGYFRLPFNSRRLLILSCREQEMNSDQFKTRTGNKGSTQRTVLPFPQPLTKWEM